MGGAHIKAQHGYNAESVLSRLALHDGRLLDRGPTEIPHFRHWCADFANRRFWWIEASTDSGKEGGSSSAAHARPVHAFSNDLRELLEASRVFYGRDLEAEVDSGYE